MTYKSQSRAW